MLTPTLITELSALNNLEEIFEKNSSQIQYWYNELSELDANKIESKESLILVVNAIRLIMQYEYTNAEELKEIAEREAVDMAEKEENWEMEKEVLKEEISNLRERITSKAGIDETNEAFRAEIDSLTSENAYLKQVGRERDRELADQRDLSEELRVRIQNLEKERSLFVNNQSQLEDQIRELNRRINLKSDAPQRNDWESRKLRQRSDQALLLSNQLQNITAQNDELKAEVERLTSALENATILIKESNVKYENYGEQLTTAEKEIERFSTDNKELKNRIMQQETLLSTNTTLVQTTNDEFSAMLSAKDAQIEELRERVKQHEVKIDELRTRLELQQNDEREEELERLRNELVSATMTARKLFGAAISENTEAERSGNGQIDPSVDLRLRIVQLDKKLEMVEQQIEEMENLNTEMQNALEQKDLINARLNAENQRLREMAFGDANSEIQRLEKQIEYRDCQIQKLSHNCTLLQVELHQRIEAVESSTIHQIGVIDDMDGEKKKNLKAKRRKNEIKTITRERRRKEQIQFNESDEVPDKTNETITSETVINEENNRPDELFTQNSDIVEINQTMNGIQQEIGKAENEPEISECQKGQELKFDYSESSAALISSLYQEAIRLKHEMENCNKQLASERKLHDEREKLFVQSKSECKSLEKELLHLKLVIFSNKSLDEIFAEIETVDQLNEEIEIAQLRNKTNHLELENIELQHYIESTQTTDDESKRRMAETSRRVVFLAIQNSKLERRAETNERLRRVIAQDHMRLNARLQRIISGEERRSRQLILENEVHLIEIARLQNTLLNSVPLIEYNRILNNYKSLLRQTTINGNSTVLSDAGYCSETTATVAEEESLNEPLDITKSSLAAASFNMMHTDSSKKTSETTTVAGSRWTDEILVKNKRLLEENNVLRSQNGFWQKEIQKKDTEIEELNAFLNDIESDTEIKSIIANIKRRFMQAIREQFDCVQDQMQCDNEIRTLRKQLQRKRNEWRAERQIFIGIILKLQNMLRKLNANKVNIDANDSSSITIDQLATLKKTIDSVKEREMRVDTQLAKIEKDSQELESKRAIFEAYKTSIEEIVNNDYQLKHIQANLQGYQLNVLTLSAELQKLRNELEKNKKLVDKRDERCEELQKQIDDFNFMNIDLNFLAEIQMSNTRLRDYYLTEAYNQQSHETTQTSRNATKQLKIQNVIDWDSSDESDSQIRNTTGLKLQQQQQPTTATSNRMEASIIVDNSQDYQQQIKAIQNAARLCVKNYQEQLEQKDRAIKEYRMLIDNLQDHLQRQNNEEKERREKQQIIVQMEMNTKTESVERPINFTEFLSLKEELETKDYSILVLQRQLRTVEEANAGMAGRLNELMDKTLIEMKQKPITNEAEIQVNMPLSAEKNFKYGEQKVEESSLQNNNNNEHKTENRKNTKNKDYELDFHSNSTSPSHSTRTSTTNSSNTEADKRQHSTSSNHSRASEEMSRINEMNTHASTINGKNNKTALVYEKSIRLQSSTLPITTTDNMETIIFRHRNETRKLRMRIAALERQNKQIANENESLKSRARFASRPLSNLNKKMNASTNDIERLQRENKNLNKSLEVNKNELKVLQERLNKSETASQNKISLDVWEEKKRHSQTINILKQRIAKFETNEQQLQERLARRETLVEQLNREHNHRLSDTERTLRERRDEKANFEKSEMKLKSEIKLWMDKHQCVTIRVEKLLKENKIIQNQVSLLQNKLTELSFSIPKSKEKEIRNVAIQTLLFCNENEQKIAQSQIIKNDRQIRPERTSPMDQEFMSKTNVTALNSSFMNNDYNGSINRRIHYPLEIFHQHDHVIPLQNSLLPAPIVNEGNHQKSREWEKIHVLTKQLRRAELLNLEATEQLQSMKIEYENLLKKYQNLLRIDMEQRREREESAALALLKDKLVGKDNDLEHRRHKIVELERKVFLLEMNQCKCKSQFG